MATEIRVPALGESVVEATVGQWFKSAGDTVNADEPLVELETDKVTVEVPAPSAGVLSEISANPGDTVEVGAVLGSIGEGEGTAPAEAKGETEGEIKGEPESAATSEPKSNGKSEPAPEPKEHDKAANENEAPLKREPSPREEAASGISQHEGTDMPPSPAARKALEEAGLQPNEVKGTGRRGQVLKEDVMRAKAGGQSSGNGAGGDAVTEILSREHTKDAPPPRQPSALEDAEREERVPMTRLRQTIAKRLKSAQDTAAMLTTFNDVDMGEVMALRSEYKDAFQKKYGVKLGFMGFFVKACCHALKEVPEVNAEIDGTDIVYKDYYHVGVAVGTEKGLVVPVIRDADRMSLAEIEKTIGAFGKRAREGKLSMEEMQGGTFTISNGGVYGSMLSTPILNAPQSGILGMHRIEERPVMRNGEIVARPMMYLALSYDHRVVDGQGAVTFLVKVKEAIENPVRLLLDL
ncbi:Dihydrolipoyllysine-residue succinyltransferase component of 2-oxoglutarate dehydrogenase complex [Methyloligella halotolerans]|uniref:Dihydrolipoyllysine-residue succinyltransferase component of 2-oxoglutarate dehydrogenase complex n=1 Tax=Methyloligella halotolerans TaxID=1177755 RepID=A0A1E2S0Z7_9HYPH|nr:2-oxoglutarate dehydrogenase complex dihydrolipoyllysine-residue succinyltransferase [Methyloligella halotolerans]ODA68157.1 Dihydrolipoyllysine-residue succinyltransferase component of 2-oxoglutarate dehydrogenase complex [Methyloligella halotolerans]